MKPSQPTAEFETIATLFRHNAWANASLFAVCAGLTEEQLGSKITGTYGSIRETLQHIVTSERSYLQRITTGKPYRRPEGSPPLPMSEMQTSIRASGEGLVVAAPLVQAQDRVEVLWEGVPNSIPCAILLTQAINHATEHRAQITATLTQIGVTPPDIDGWTYFRSLER
jgi:uncharacterized damage-inducible protein DinB